MTLSSVFEKKLLSIDKREADLSELLNAWRSINFLREIDLAFARFLWMEIPQASALSILSAALLSYQLGRGHVCLDLEYFLKNPNEVLDFPVDVKKYGSGKYSPSDIFRNYDTDLLIKELSSDIFERDSGNSPLVCDGKRLYLRRYWEYEQNIINGLMKRLKEKNAFSNEDLKLIRDNLSALFPKKEDGIDWQKAACALSVYNNVSIITGGPGTGKTTTVFRLLVLLQSIALSKDPEKPLRIKLAAPTGKAAARLSASITEAKENIALDGFKLPDLIRDSIPSQASTLHRLLGTVRNSRRFRHDSDNPLGLDVLVIDEASMIDLEMMSSVISALPENARLILIGDKDQLASVEAGSVLGELCRFAESGHYNEDTAKWLENAADIVIPENLCAENEFSIHQATAMLCKNYRFADDLGIARFARAVNNGDVNPVFGLMEESLSDAVFLKIKNTDEDLFRKTVIGGYGNYLRITREGMTRLNEKSTQEDYDKWARDVLSARESFQILCVVREDSFGVDGVNEKIRQILLKEKLIEENGEWYLGRPVIVTKNSYDLGLMNGDMGVTLRDNSGSLRVAFLSDEDKVKWVSPSRLQPVCEPVYALTVHKSQGSEFSHALLILPEQINPVLTRELLYTGITRAREKFTLVYSGDKELLRQAIETRVHRMSGLSEAIENYSSSK